MSLATFDLHTRLGPALFIQPPGSYTLFPSSAVYCFCSSLPPSRSFRLHALALLGMHPRYADATVRGGAYFRGRNSEGPRRRSALLHRRRRVREESAAAAAEEEEAEEEFIWNLAGRHALACCLPRPARGCWRLRRATHLYQDVLTWRRRIGMRRRPHRGIIG